MVVPSSVDWIPKLTQYCEEGDQLSKLFGEKESQMTGRNLEEGMKTILMNPRKQKL